MQLWVIHSVPPVETNPAPLHKGGYRTDSCSTSGEASQETHNSCNAKIVLQRMQIEVIMTLCSVEEGTDGPDRKLS